MVQSPQWYWPYTQRVNWLIKTLFHTHFSGGPVFSASFLHFTKAWCSHPSSKGTMFYSKVPLSHSPTPYLQFQGLPFNLPSVTAQQHLALLMLLRFPQVYPLPLGTTTSLAAAPPSPLWTPPSGHPKRWVFPGVCPLSSPDTHSMWGFVHSCLSFFSSPDFDSFSSTRIVYFNHSSKFFCTKQSKNRAYIPIFLWNSKHPTFHVLPCPGWPSSQEILSTR